MITSRLTSKGQTTIPRSVRQALNLGDVVRVPFPYTDRPIRQHRPALVISRGGIGDE